MQREIHHRLFIYTIMFFSSIEWMCTCISIALQLLVAHTRTAWNLGPVSISDMTSYRKISRSLDAARLVVQIIVSLWNLTGTLAAVLLRCLSKFRAIGQFLPSISWLRDFTRFYNKTSYRILKQGPGQQYTCWLSSIFGVEHRQVQCWQHKH